MAIHDIVYGVAVFIQSILKWGNSLAIRLPSAIAKQMNINEGVEVEFHVDGNRLVIQKAERIPRFTHRDLVKALSKAKKYRLDSSPPRGEEIL
jgi:antitoxin MazE